MVHLYRAGHLCVDLEYEAALSDALEARSIESRIDLWAGPFSAAAMQSMVLLVLGRPEESLEVLESVDETIMSAMQIANGEPLRALALIECGQLERGRELARQVVVRGVRRRYAYEPNDCVVLLAALALAEHDDATARDLVLSAGTGSGWSVIVADHLAHRLDVSGQRRQRILDSIRSRDTDRNTREASEALRAELARRGWLAQAGPPVQVDRRQ